MAKGHFVGDVVARWLKDGRKMKLREDFQFVDSKGIKCSIPKILWASVGPPFVGKYRRATVLHDVACVERSKPHKKTHRMLYEAMLADNTPKLIAKKIYYAVAMFGPKWDKNGKDLTFDDDKAFKLLEE